jgi:hypothetical protein
MLRGIRIDPDEPRPSAGESAPAQIVGREYAATFARHRLISANLSCSTSLEVANCNVHEYFACFRSQVSVR